MNLRFLKPRKKQSTYVTPYTPRQACLNALSEIEANSITDLDRQAEVILFHLRDFEGGRVFLAMRRAFTPEMIVRMLCDGEDCEKSLRKRAG